MKYGLSPVNPMPTINELLCVVVLSIGSVLKLPRLTYLSCNMPKTTRAEPPIKPTNVRKPERFSKLDIPTPISITSGSSTSIWPTEITKPDLAPPFAPCSKQAANRGPGMRAPEAVTTTTVAANVRRLGENCTKPSAPEPRHSLIDFSLAV
jgi:hypothetical protein